MSGSHRLAIHLAAAGNVDAVAKVVADSMPSPDDDANRLVMNWAIRCSEAWAQWDPAVTARNAGNSFFGPMMVAMANLTAIAGASWPKATVPAADAEPVRSDKPVLLLVGGADPADPPENSASASETLPNSLTAIFPAGGHDVETYGCAPALMTTFINAGTARGLDVSCAANAPLPPFDVSR